MSSTSPSTELRTADSVAGRLHLHDVRRLAFSRVGAAVLFLIALATFGLESIAWPLSNGRDGTTYLQYYIEMWRTHTVHPELMLLRTPVAPLVFGPLFQLGGVGLAEVGLGLLFAGSVVAIAAAAASINNGLAVATAIAVLAYPSNGGLFHQISSDPVCALGIALVVLAAVRVARRPSTVKLALLGVLVVAFILVRPANQMLLLLALLPLMLPGSWRSRLLGAAAFIVSAVSLLACWATYNDLRYDDFTVARTASAQIPLNRAFRVERIVSPDNGPASRELGALVQRLLLAREPYRSYGITEKQFFSSGSSRMYYDLLVASDEGWGWNSDYSKLRQVGIEAVEAHPGLYVYGVANTLWTELLTPYSMRTPRRAVEGGSAAGAAETIVVNGRRLPKPSQGEPIPGERLFWLDSTPDHRIWTDWSDVAHPVTRYRSAADRTNAAAVSRQLFDWDQEIPARNGVTWLSTGLNGISSKLPPMLVWLLLGLPSLLLWRLPQVRALVVVTGASLLVIAFTALGEPTTLEFALPFQPLFILFGLTGVTAVLSRFRFANHL